MKALHLALALAFSVLLSSCASGPERRISSNPQAFSKLSTVDQEAVKEGRIREGMEKETVFLAWGKPNSVSVGKRNGKDLERWSYNTLRPVYVNTFGMGVWGGGWRGGCGGWGGWGGPMMMSNMVDYVPSPGPSVEFTSGRVTGYTMPRY